jgi:hypothetical protein
VTPALFALMGYDALVGNRIHYGLKRLYRSEHVRLCARHMTSCRCCGDRVRARAWQDMEFIWSTASLGFEDRGSPSTDMFVHILHTHYRCAAVCALVCACVCVCVVLAAKQ